jgi:hypothetical protein
MKPPQPSERQIQRSILAMCGVAFPDVLIAHVPNGAHLSGDDRARCMQMGALKGDGLKIGFPDLIAIWNHGVAFLEVKRPGGKLSPQQLIMHVRLNELGFTPAVVTSPGEAFAFLKERGAPSRVREWREAA